MPLASLYYILRPSPGFCRFSPLTDALATLCRGPPTATGAALPARAVCPQCLQVYAPDGPSPMTETGGPEPSPYLQFYWKSVTPARLCIIYGCFPGGKAESSSCNRHRMACKGHIYYWSYDKTSWPTAVLDNALHTPSPFSPQELCTCYSSCLTFSFLDSVDGQVASHLFRSQQKCPFLRKAFLVHSSKSPSASLFQCPVFLALTALKLLPLFTGCCALLRDQPVQRLDEGQKPSLSRSVRDPSAWPRPCTEHASKNICRLNDVEEWKILPWAAFKRAGSRNQVLHLDGAGQFDPHSESLLPEQGEHISSSSYISA